MEVSQLEEKPWIKDPIGATTDAETSELQLECVQKKYPANTGYSSLLHNDLTEKSYHFVGWTRNKNVDVRETCDRNMLLGIWFSKGQPMYNWG